MRQKHPAIHFWKMPQYLQQSKCSIRLPTGEQSVCLIRLHGGGAAEVLFTNFPVDLGGSIHHSPAHLPENVFVECLMKTGVPVLQGHLSGHAMFCMVMRW